jgi:hypothetical protein
MHSKFSASAHYFLGFLNPTKSQEFVNQFAFQGDQVGLPLIAKDTA